MQRWAWGDSAPGGAEGHPLGPSCKCVISVLVRAWNLACGHKLVCFSTNFNRGPIYDEHCLFRHSKHSKVECPVSSTAIVKDDCQVNLFWKVQRERRGSGPREKERTDDGIFPLSYLLLPALFHSFHGLSEHMMISKHAFRGENCNRYLVPLFPFRSVFFLFNANKASFTINQ